LPLRDIRVPNFASMLRLGLEGADKGSFGADLRLLRESRLGMRSFRVHELLNDQLNCRDW